MIGKKKLGLFGVCLSLLLMLMGSDSFALAKVVSTTSKADWTTYNVEKEFKISTPTNWQRLDDGSGKYFKLQVASGKEAILTIGMMPMPAGVSTLDGLAKSNKENFKKDSGLQGEINNTRFQGKGWTGEKFKYCRETQDPEGKNVIVSYTNYLIVVGKSYYVIEMGVLQEKEAEYTEIFREIIQSFQLLKK